jgi:ferric-dicitrate binding protein FerR (iron transport regulator)
MNRHDERALWDYAARTLDPDDRQMVEHHLEACPECGDQLASIELAQRTLRTAREALPRVGYERLDERIGAVVERRLQRQARRSWVWGGALVGFAAVAALLVAFFWARPPAVTEPVAPEVAVVTPPPLPSPGPDTRVDRAEGLVRVGNDAVALHDGESLQGGDVLRTSLAGRALLHLPDESHLRVGASTELSLTRSDADDVALTLERGRIAVQASHSPRKGFAVHTGGVTVHVVGTVFAVTSGPEGVEVAVSEGKVRVDRAQACTGKGCDTFVEAGQRVRFDPNTLKPTLTRGLTPSLKSDLAEVAALGETASAVENRAPTVQPSNGGRLPRLSTEEARARQASGLAAASTQKPQAQVEVEAGNSWPSLGGERGRGVPEARESQTPPGGPSTMIVPTLPPVSSNAAAAAPEANDWAPLPAPAPAVVPAPAPAPAVAPAPSKMTEEWAPLPASAPAAAVVAPAPAPAASPAPPPSVTTVTSRGPARDLETAFLQRAEASLEKGACDRFLLGLEEIATDGQHNAHSEQARVLRARCFDVQLSPRKALTEYRKYLDEYPQGHFVPEAHEALGQ